MRVELRHVTRSSRPLVSPVALVAIACLTLAAGSRPASIPVASSMELASAPSTASSARVIAAAAASEARDYSGHSRVFRIPIEGMVDLGMAPFVRRIVEQATDEGAAVLLDISTFGGRVDAAVLIRDQLIDAQVPTIAFVDRRAISAGALIALACETIAIAPGGTIGAATPILLGGGGGDEDDGKPDAADEKMMSYMRTEMRSTAERRGRSSDIAAAMVDPDVEIDGLVEKGKVLTLTTADAMTHHIADLEAPDLDSLLQTLGLGDAEVVEGEINWAERIARIVSDPTISSLLLSIGFLGIMLELYQPGWGLPGTVGVISLLTFFAGHHVVHLAGLEELMLFVLGLILLALEAFVIPGFGVTGIAGLALVSLSVVMTMLALDLKVSWELGLLREAMVVLSSSLMLTVVFMFVALRLLPATRFGRRMVLVDALSPGPGFTVEDPEPRDAVMTGGLGECVSDLRPAGKVRVDGRRIDAVSDGGYIAAGEPVEVIGWRAGAAVVRRTAAAVDGGEDDA